jgi:hypothetical protein
MAARRSKKHSSRRSKRKSGANEEIRRLLELAEKDPEALIAAVRETYESLTLPDREPFNPKHRCGKDCWHKQVPKVEIPLSPSEVQSAAEAVSFAARFIRKMFL